jgi:hypothetical protein
MKTKILLTAIFSICILPLMQAQDKNSDEIQTIFGSGKKVSHGGYAAFTTGYTQIAGKDVVTLGGRAGWLIDHHMTIGLAGNGFASSVYINNVVDNQGFYLVGGYGGFFVEPIIAPKFPVHVSFPVIFGIGGAAYNYNTWADYDWEHNNNNQDYFYDSDAFFIIEPGMEIELNVVKFFRISFGGTYRFTKDLHLVNTSTTLLDGFSVNISFKLGKF